MHSNEHEVLTQALHWLLAGQRCVLATVLRTFGASPRPPGAMAVISEQGLIVGSVSGGCVEDDLVHEVMGGVFWREAAAPTPAPTPAPAPAPALPRPVALRVYGRDAAERERYRLPCGHALRLAVEALDAVPTAARSAGGARSVEQIEQIEHALALIRRRQTVLRRVHYASGAVSLQPTPSQGDFTDDEHGFAHVLGPRHRLLLIGATEVSRYLLPVAQSLGFAVTICDPRREYTQAWLAAGVPIMHEMPDDAVLAFACDARTAVVTVTHDPKLDDLALMEALKSPAFYVGALGSALTTSRRKARLRMFELSAEQVAALRGPVGLPIGSRSPAEIAVSIAAELVQVRRLMETGAEAAAQDAPRVGVASPP